MSEWDIEVRGAQKVALVYAADNTAYDVVVSVSGAVSAFSQPNWSISIPEITEGDTVIVKYRRAQGANQDPPRVRVRFRHSAEGDEGFRVEEFLLP